MRFARFEPLIMALSTKGTPSFIHCQARFEPVATTEKLKFPPAQIVPPPGLPEIIVTGGIFKFTMFVFRVAPQELVIVQ